MFDWVSAILGFIAGLIIMLIIGWIAYASRAFVFSYCPSQTPNCAGADYYNDPADALANGYQVADIMYVGADKHLYYKRVPRVNNCTPQGNQTVKIVHPQYCQVVTSEGTIHQAKNMGFNTPDYEVVVNGERRHLESVGGCLPASTETFVDGQPIVHWDEQPFTY